MSDLREGLDGLQSDMADHQRRFRGEVTADANQRLAVETVERMDRMRANTAPAPSLAGMSPPPIEESTEMRDGKHGRYVVDKGPDAPLATRPPSQVELDYFVHAIHRIRFLLTKVESGPLGSASWSQKTMAVLDRRAKALDFRRAGNRDRAAELDRRYVLELTALLEDSSSVFGDWRADAPEKISIAVR